jgi:hypothetical protein
MLHIDPQHTNTLPPADNQQRVKTLSAHAADPPFGDGVGVRRLNRCTDDLDPGRAPHLIERPGELGVRSRIRNLNPPACSSRTATRLRVCWATHHPVGWAVTPARWTRRLPSSMTNSTYTRRRKTVSTVKKAARQDPGGLLAQERPPARCSAAERRVTAVGAQHPPDRAGRQPYAKAQQLAVDSLVAPSWVLAGKPHDRPLHLLRYRSRPLEVDG